MGSAVGDARTQTERSRVFAHSSRRPNFRLPPTSGLLTFTVLLAGPFPAAAQSGLAAVVCVGSERQTLASSGPVRRVITEDVAVVYRVGVRANDREVLEQSLIGELGDPAEASCAWSSHGDNHVAIIRYTGAIRGDLALDPDDQRFQAFAVGYGRSAESAEENATTVNARFATYYDGSGYDLLVAESWVGGASDAPASAPADGAGVPRVSPAADPTLTTGGQTNPDRTPPVDAAETCAAGRSVSGCWMEPSNQPDCNLWIWTYLMAARTATWSGRCSGGYAQGAGTTQWHDDDETMTGEGVLVDGKQQGNWTFRDSDGRVFEGPFVDGEAHGDWKYHSVYGTTYLWPFVHGKLDGDSVSWGSDGSVTLTRYVDGKRNGDSVSWSEDGSVSLYPIVDGEYHGIAVLCKSGYTANVQGVWVYENNAQVERYFRYEWIEDPQLARAAAAVCVRALSLKKPSPRPRRGP